MSYYKVGNLILKSSNEYIKNNYPLIEQSEKPISETEYDNQFIPFKYTNHLTFKQMKQSSFIIVELTSIYNEICDKLDIKYNSFGYNDIIYINNQFIKNHLDKNLPNNMMKYIIDKVSYDILCMNYKFLNNVFVNEYFDDESQAYDVEDIYFKDINKCKNKICDIYATHKIFNILNADELYLKILDKLKFYINILNSTNEILNCNKFELLAILIEKLNINISKYQFDYNLYANTIDEKFKYYNTIINSMKKRKL